MIFQLLLAGTPNGSGPLWLASPPTSENLKCTLINRENGYIQFATLNGKPFIPYGLSFADSAYGNVLPFEMR